MISNINPWDALLVSDIISADDVTTTPGNDSVDITTTPTEKEVTPRLSSDVVLISKTAIMVSKVVGIDEDIVKFDKAHTTFKKNGDEISRVSCMDPPIQRRVLSEHGVAKNKLHVWQKSFFLKNLRDSSESDITRDRKIKVVYQQYIYAKRLLKSWKISF